MTFGEKLKFLRKQKGFSQERLSQQLTVSRQAISKWELGESLPDTENVIQLSKLFSVSIDFLLNDNICSEADIHLFCYGLCWKYYTNCPLYNDKGSC